MSEELTDEQAINQAVDMLKERGIFDQIRKNCLEDINTKSSYLNLNQRCEGYVNKFLQDREWDTTLNKNQLREKLRKSIMESGIIKSGVTHLVEQVINPVSFEGKIEEQLRELLGIEEDDLIKSEETNKFDDKLSDKLDDISDDEISGDELVDRNEQQSYSTNNSSDDVRIKHEREYEEYGSNEMIDSIDTKLDDIRCAKNSENNIHESMQRERYEESITSSISSTDDLDCMD